jgi:hypothetical protein
VQGESAPRPVFVRLGLTDGSHTEVLPGDLGEGTNVIVGTSSDPGARSPPMGKAFRLGF